MGKGGYHGGSTVIGRWSSDWFEPRDDLIRDEPKKEPRRPKKAAATASSAGAGTKAKAQKKSPKEHRAQAEKAAKRKQQRLRAKQKDKGAELGALRRERAKQDAEAQKARAAMRKGKAAKSPTPTRPVAVVPKVPAPGEVAIFSSRTARIPEVEVRTADGRRIKIETAAKSSPKRP